MMKLLLMMNQIVVKMTNIMMIQNILIQMNEYGTDIENIKLIDFGSAFQFHNVTQITATTPEYLAPEILDYLE